MNDEEVRCSCGAPHPGATPRERLVAVLHQQADEDFDWRDAEEFADALLPVVREIAAEELREAADALDTRAVELWNAYKSGPISDARRASPHTEGESDGWENAATLVQRRADALTKPPSTEAS